MNRNRIKKFIYFIIVVFLIIIIQTKSSYADGLKTRTGSFSVVVDYSSKWEVTGGRAPYSVSVQNKNVVKASIKNKNNSATVSYTALSNGSSKIYVRDSNGVEIPCVINVLPKVNKIQIVGIPGFWLPTNYNFRLGTVLTPNVYKNGKITWISSNNNIATVDSNGYIYTKNPGTVEITAVYSDGVHNNESIRSTAKIIVKKQATYCKIDRSKVTIGKNESLKINGSYDNNVRSAKFISNNNNIVAVDEKTGKITGKGVGTTKVKYIVDNGKKNLAVECEVTVKNEPSSLNLNISSISLGKGEKYSLSESTNKNSYANAENISWSSSNSDVVSISNTEGTGKIEIVAKNTGTSNIKVKIYNGKTATCKVTVKNAPSSIKINTTSVDLYKDKTATLSESTNSGSYAREIKWTIGNTDIASITSTSGGKVQIKAIKAGQTTLSVRTYNGREDRCIINVKMGTRDNLVNYIKAQKDHGSSQYNSYFNCPNSADWCANFVGYCIEHYGGKGSANRCVGYSMNVGVFADNASKLNICKKYGKYTPKKGDIVIFGTSTKEKDGYDYRTHIGFVTKVYNDGSIDTIEGNTGPANAALAKVGGYHRTYDKRDKQEVYKTEDSGKKKKEFIWGFIDVSQYFSD